MPTAWQRIVSKTDSNIVNALNGVEIVYTTISVTDVAPDSVVRFYAMFSCQPGAAVTAVAPRIRRGGVTGTLVGLGGNVNVTASTSVNIPYGADDSPGDVANQTYSLCMVSTGGTTTQGVTYVIAIVG